jgi:hypothetical protein
MNGATNQWKPKFGYFRMMSQQKIVDAIMLFYQLKVPGSISITQILP